MELEELHQKLIEDVIVQIQQDLKEDNVECIEELLKYCPVENLVSYLPELDWEPYKELIETKK